MKRFLWITLMLLSLTSWTFADTEEAEPMSVFEQARLESAQTVPPLPAEPSWLHLSRLTVGGRMDDNRQDYLIDAFVPAWEDGRCLFALNLRGVFLEDKEQQAGAGVVARHLMAERSAIIGFNLFLDARWTESNNRYEQVGAGVEWLSTWGDARANYYYPLTSKKERTSTSQTRSEIQGGRVITTTSLLRTYEEAMAGWDAEVGVWLPYLSEVAPTVFFIGYYDFSADDADNVSGFKARLESRLHPHVTFDVEWYEDDKLNGSDYIIGARVHVPLDVWNGASFNRDQPRTGRMRAFPGRLNDMVIRDYRIRVVQSGVLASDPLIDTRSLPAPAVVPPVSPPTRPNAPPPPNCFLDSEGEVVCP